jgi:hypothetical protein
MTALRRARASLARACRIEQARDPGQCEGAGAIACALSRERLSGILGQMAFVARWGATPSTSARPSIRPILSESIGMAAEVLEGVCTDLPPAKKR